MPIYTKDNGGDFEPLPTGMLRAICANVYDVGLQPGYQGGPNARKIIIMWEIDYRSEKTGKRMTITKIYTNSINKKSNLGADLVSWRSKAFTEEELKGFDLEKIIGVPCQLNLVPHEKKEGRVVIASVLPRDKGNEYWNLETPRDYTPEFVQKMIDGQLIQSAKHGPMEFKAADGFNDDIPF